MEVLRFACKRRWCLPEDEELHLQNKEELFMKEKEPL
jgi:hypothetical protein